MYSREWIINTENVGPGYGGYKFVIQPPNGIESMVARLLNESKAL